jgi:hypothetical protein
VQLARGPMSFLIIVGSQSSLADLHANAVRDGTRRGLARPNSVLAWVNEGFPSTGLSSWAE